MTVQNFAPQDPFGAIAEHGKGRILPQSAREWFIANGVPPVNLVKNWLGYFDMVLHDDIVFLDNGCFEFARYLPGKATPALTFQCWSRDDIAEDVCAWQVTTGKIATWLGHACMMGEDNLIRPRLDPGLAVHPGPLSWFQAHRSGVVVLDIARAAPMLRDAGSLTVSSLNAAQNLKKSLAVELPNILVPEGASA